MKNRSVKALALLPLLAGCSAIGHQIRHLTGGLPVRLADDVVIERDSWGVPHIHGRSDEAVAFGVAWAMAEDNYRELEEGYIRALGRSAYYYGASHLADDLVQLAFEVETQARAEYEREPESRRRLWDGFALGLNYYLSENPKQPARVITRYEPWMVLARVRRASAEQLAGDIRLGEVAQLVGAPEAGSSSEPRARGGAAWAIGPARSQTGRALLLSSVARPFFGIDEPYELELRSETGWQVYGLATVGTPVPFSGVNAHLGWGLAAVASDSAVIHVLVFDDPVDSLVYRSGGREGKAVAWVDTVYVNTAAGVQARPYRFLRTELGPIISRRGDTAYAVLLPGFREGGRLQQLDALGRSRSLAEFTAALTPGSLPGEAIAYADTAGNILSWNGSSGSLVVNPAGGEVRVSGAAGFAGHERAGESGWRPGDLAAAALGVAAITSPEEIGELVRQWEQIGGRNSARAFGMDSAVEMLRRWDGRTGLGGGQAIPGGAVDSAVVAADSARATAATLYETWRDVQRETRVGPDGSAAGVDTFPLFSSLERAVAQLRREWGTIQVPWRDAVRLQRPDFNQPDVLDGETAGLFSDEAPSLAIAGMPGGSLFVLQTVRGPGRRRYAVSGTAAVLVTEFSSTPASRSIVVFGQSGDPASSHFFDQAAAYASGRLKDVAAGADAARESYHPGGHAAVLQNETPPPEFP